MHQRWYLPGTPIPQYYGAVHIFTYEAASPRAASVPALASSPFIVCTNLVVHRGIACVDSGIVRPAEENECQSQLPDSHLTSDAESV